MAYEAKTLYGREKQMIREREREEKDPFIKHTRAKSSLFYVQICIQLVYNADNILLFCFIHYLITQT